MIERTPNGNKNPPATPKVATQELETALKGLAKLLGAIRFYPAGHPALRDVTRDARLGFLPLLKEAESVTFQVRREGFMLNDKPFGAENPMLQKLAGGLFARRVQRLMILNDVSCRDLWGAAQVLLQTAAELQRQGGIQDALQRARVSTLWVNVVDVASILERKKRLEQDKAALFGTREGDDEKFLDSLGRQTGEEGLKDWDTNPADGGQDQTDEMTLARLLTEIEHSASEQNFVRLLPQIPPLVRVNLNVASAALVLRALLLVLENAKDPRIPAAKRDVARQTLEQLRVTDILAFVADLLCERSLPDEQRQNCLKAVDAFGEPLAQRLMARLAEEGDQAIRKTLSEALVRQGSVALKAVLPFLQDDRWYVVRNAAYITGEIREPSTVEQLKPILQHPDLRVRREAIRALTRIGGTAVVGILLRSLQGDDADLRRQAMLSLGAMKNPAAVPSLIQFIQAPDWRVRQLEGKKDAIRALGEIGSSDALPALAEIVDAQKFFYRARYNELRAAAVLAIGEIGGEDAVQFLEVLIDSSSQVLARTAGQALKQARRIHRK